MISKELQKKIDFAIKLLQTAAYQNDEPIEIAYSGGKDSDVILQLAKEAGIKYRAIYKNTTIDPPGTIEHVRKMGVEIVRPKKSFITLVSEKGFPSRQRRFCCEVLKEYKILDKCVLGIRTEESSKRANRYKEPTQCRLYKRGEHVEQILPILSWTKKDVEDFIKDRGIICAPIYYNEKGEFCANRRLGCIGCPISTRNHRIEEFARYPKMVKLYVKAGRKYLETHKNTKTAKRYVDEYAFFYRNVFCEKQTQYEYEAGGMFGTPDFKCFLERKFNIKL